MVSSITAAALALLLASCQTSHGFVPRDVSVSSAHVAGKPPVVPSSALLIGTSNAESGGNDSVADTSTKADAPVEGSSSGNESVADTSNKADAPVEGSIWDSWSESVGISAPKLSVRPATAEERGKGGVFASEDIAALEVITRIPANLVISAKDAPTRAIEAAANANEITWATELTAAAIVALHPEVGDNDDESISSAKQSWVSSWQAGGWATHASDLGKPDAQLGPKFVTGNLLATGSDLDKEIYAKFRMPCHPVVHRASIGLAFLTKADEDDCREALMRRGKTYRSMRDALLPLVAEPSDERKGSMRERRAWDVADVMSRVLSRATYVSSEGDVPTPAIVPLYERLEHCTDAQGENVRLVSSDDGKELLLVATRDIAKEEAIVRDYTLAPQLDGDDSDGALRLLLQFGLPPKAWPKSEE